MHKPLLISCLLISQSLFASESIWTDIESDYQYRQANNAANAQQRHLQLDLRKLTELLTADATLSGQKHLEIPLPNGEMVALKLEPSRVLAPGLAKRYPNIRTWKVSHPNNPAIQGRIDLTPQGFHGLIRTETGKRVFIDPDKTSNTNRYVSRHASTTHEQHDFNCQLHNKPSPITYQSPLEKIANRVIGGPADSLRTYRLAIATTGEYTQLFGGTKSDALSSIVTTVNRVNQVFERDLGVNLELVDNNDRIIYTSPFSDPYSNEDASAMVEENIVNINAIIGEDNYDIGHVFGTGNTGGLAFLNSACGTYKAGGVTGSNNPTGEAFNIDYVAHEIGHQLGASHTFNGHQLNCSANNREATSAVEPGSGSSIMGYAGICGTDNLQANSDGFFHSVSINQIKDYMQTAFGSSCGTLTPQTNNNPTVSAGIDYTIPAETPFKLSGSTSDIDADPILHSWEQVDIGSAGGLHTDLGDNPLFRVWPPVASNVRYFPRLTDTLNRTETIGETLPTTDRQLNFTLLARDNKGGITQDNMSLDVINTGRPFAVLSQTTDTTLSAKQQITVTWDVANTTQLPISCSHVDIGLINSEGLVSTLATQTPNDGSHQLTTPDDIISVQNARLQVRCTDNIFFAVSEGAINVLGGSPVISVNSPSIVEEDSGIRHLTFTLLLSTTALENIAINYEITDNSSSAIIKQGTVVINKSTNTANIHVQVAGDTLHENNQILNLTLQKPLNAQFANESSTLSSQGTIIDDDTSLAPAANPEIVAPTVNNAGGGGTFSLLAILGLLLLSLRRQTILRIQ